MSRRSLVWFAPWACLLACGSDGNGSTSGSSPKQQSHSASIVASHDGSTLFVTHPDADSVTLLDTAKRTIEHEVLLGAGHPSIDPTTRRYDPAIEPRALALDTRGTTLYVSGRRSGRLYAVDVQTASVRGEVAVCSEPVGVVISADDADVYVACSADEEVVQVSASTLNVVGSVVTPRKPWALAWGADGKTLYVTHLLGPGVSVLATAPLALQTTWPVADGDPRPNPTALDAREDPTEPHGQVRGLYDAAVRPGCSELWVAHMMLGTDTAQPSLVFNNTVFPALSLFDETGAPLARLTVQANPGDHGAFGDVVSGPRAVTFTDDGRYAFLVDSDSEDVLVVDAANRVESQIVRPLPGHLPEGAVFSHGKLYVQERNTEDVAVFQVTSEGEAGLTVAADGDAFSSLANDPMPADLRLGQKLFFSANSDDVPTTQDHWVACATCHLEGRSDAVTWRFAQGPRDTPTNAGGTLDTGFLFRTADRNQVQDYWRTIDVEQGGHFSVTEPAQKPLLDAIAAYVNYALAAPVPPSTDETHTLAGVALAARRAQGETIFNRLGCNTCHSGSAKTDSGMGNTSLLLSAPVVSEVSATPGVLLHDVGTCVTSGPWPDVAHEDIAGNPRPACAFDTPALRGLADSAPYMHDGSAATLEAAITLMLGAVPQPAAPPSADDLQALAEYLRGL